MIVKNEENDVAECLKSFIDEVLAVVIVDTGSTDRTIEICREILDASFRRYEIITYLDANDSMGRICDFSAARNRCISALEKYGTDYLMMADADDTLITRGISSFIKANPADFYGVKYNVGSDLSFTSYRIWRNNMGVKYDGRVHECLRIDWKKKVIITGDIEVLHRFTPPVPGMESGTERNMRILRPEIYPSLRSIFYWANENVDAGNHDEAVRWYLEYIRRAKDEGAWSAELAHCYFRAARWCGHLGRVNEAVALSKELLESDPSWSEAWCELAYQARRRGDWKQMQRYAERAAQNAFVPRLFSERDKYTTVPANFILIAKLLSEASNEDRYNHPE